jgi:hypothetical protein
MLHAKPSVVAVFVHNSKNAIRSLRPLTPYVASNDSQYNRIASQFNCLGRDLVVANDDRCATRNNVWGEWPAEASSILQSRPLDELGKNVCSVTKSMLGDFLRAGASLFVIRELNLVRLWQQI